MRVTQLIIPGVVALALSAAPTAVAAAGGASATSSGGGGSGVTPAPASGATPASSASSGGVGVSAGPVPLSTDAHPIVPGSVAKIKNGIAYAPSYAPAAVQRAIWAGNLIRRTPYIWGGGHSAFVARGYDCSGSVSFVLHAAGLLKAPLDSSDFMHWGLRGAGHWITIYTNPGHAFVEIAGIRFDTSAEADPHPAKGSGPRWRPLFVHPAGFMARHQVGF